MEIIIGYDGWKRSKQGGAAPADSPVLSLHSDGSWIVQVIPLIALRFTNSVDACNWITANPDRMAAAKQIAESRNLTIAELESQAYKAFSENYWRAHARPANNITDKKVQKAKAVELLEELGL